MSNSNKKWFEIWFVEGVDLLPAYLVVVTPDPDNHNEIIVIDNQDNKVLYRGNSYEDVHNWLTEDEFSFVAGRVFEF
jgi:hypothetical protein